MAVPADSLRLWNECWMFTKVQKCLWNTRVAVVLIIYKGFFPKMIPKIGWNKLKSVKDFNLFID